MPRDTLSSVGQFAFGLRLRPWVLVGSQLVVNQRPKASTRTRLAYHEAGHAVLSAAIANPPDIISIRTVGHTLGHNGLRLSNRLAARIQVHLAGFAAEHLFTGRRPRQLHHEVGLALLGRIDPSLVEEFEHRDERDGFRAVEDILRTAMLDDDEVWREIDQFYSYTRESLAAAWMAVEKVAKALLKREELDRAAFDELTETIDLYALVRPLQRKHGLLPPTLTESGKNSRQTSTQRMLKSSA